MSIQSRVRNEDSFDVAAMDRWLRAHVSDLPDAESGKNIAIKIRNNNIDNHEFFPWLFEKLSKHIIVQTTLLKQS